MERENGFSSESWRFAFSHFTEAANNISAEINSKIDVFWKQIESLKTRLSNIESSALKLTSGVFTSISDRVAAVEVVASTARNLVDELNVTTIAQSNSLYDLDQTSSFLRFEAIRLTKDNENQDKFVLDNIGRLNNDISRLDTNNLNQDNFVVNQIGNLNQRCDGLFTNVRARPLSIRYRVEASTAVANTTGAGGAFPLTRTIAPVGDLSIDALVNRDLCRYTANRNVNVRISVGWKIAGDVVKLSFAEHFAQYSGEARDPAFMHVRVQGGNLYLHSADSYNLAAGEWIQITYNIVGSTSLNVGDGFVIITENSYW